MKKTIRVILSDDANKQYEELNKIVGEELRKNIENSIHQQLLKSIKQKIELLKINPQAGTHISRKLIPSFYKDKYDVNNLWKMDLSGVLENDLYIKHNRNRNYKFCAGFC